jgi:acetyl esterase/lipase
MRPAARESDHPASIALWDDGAPGSESRKSQPEKVDWRDEPENDITFPITFNIHDPSITPYLPAKEKATGAAIIVAPGGGHMVLTMDREGYDVGRWLADRGVAAFVLKYRLARDHAGGSAYRVEVDPLMDMQRAIRMVRGRASQWNIDPARIGIMGFSAGGEIVLLAGAKHDAGRPSAADPVERHGCRPDFQVAVYPVRPPAWKVTRDAPPAFWVCADDDPVVPAEKLAEMYLAFRRAEVPVELHIYARGGHGFGVRQRPLAITDWPVRVLEWMRDSGWIGQ